jgi:hypothetical protein
VARPASEPKLILTYQASINQLVPSLDHVHKGVGEGKMLDVQVGTYIAAMMAILPSEVVCGTYITAMMAILPSNLVILSGVGTERKDVILSVGSGVRSRDLTTQSC